MINYQIDTEMRKLTEAAMIQLKWWLENGNMAEKLKACEIILNSIRFTKGEQ